MDSHPSSSRIGRAAAAARSRLTFSNLTAVLALFVALGGSSYAAIRVGSAEIADNSIRSKDIHDGEVRGPDIAKGTIRGTDVRDGDLQGRDIRDHTISGADVKESSFGKVPLAGDADTLGGKNAAAFLAQRQARPGGTGGAAEGRGAHRGHQRPVHLDGAVHRPERRHPPERQAREHGGRQLRRLVRGRRRCRVPRARRPRCSTAPAARPGTRSPSRCPRPPPAAPRPWAWPSWESTWAPTTAW